jgi:transcriptional regulator with XRE-family HTH domain
MASLGEKLRKHRQEKGYSLDKLAEITDSSKSYLWELEIATTSTTPVAGSYVIAASKTGR